MRKSTVSVYRSHDLNHHSKGNSTALNQSFIGFIDIFIDFHAKIIKSVIFSGNCEFDSRIFFP